MIITSISMYSITYREGEKPSKTLHPWYRGFTGSIIQQGTSYQVRGRAEWTDDHTLYISELPVGKWTQDYKNYLCELIQQGKLVSSFKENHTDTEVSFTVTVREEDAKQLHENMDRTMKEFKLTSMLRYVTILLSLYIIGGWTENWNKNEVVLLLMQSRSHNLDYSRIALLTTSSSILKDIFTITTVLTTS